MVHCRQSEKGEFSRRYEAVQYYETVFLILSTLLDITLTALNMSSALAGGGTQELGRRTYSSSSGVKMHMFSTAGCRLTLTAVVYSLMKCVKDCCVCPTCK